MTTVVDRVFRMRNELRGRVVFLLSSGVSMVMALVVAIVLVGALSSPVEASDWVDDWFDQSTSSGPGSYQSQQRGFYSAGSFTARRRMTNDYLVTTAPPRLDVGCGGVDLFLGGFSYLDSEYLVEKFERVLQAAPALAFQIAMQEYCKPCVAGLEAMEAITNQLNTIQMNDCQAAKGLATMIVDPSEVGPRLQGAAAQARDLYDGIEKNVTDFQNEVQNNNGKPPNSTEEVLFDCPTQFKDVFANGSVLANITSLVGMGDYTDTMRGLIGDAVVTYDAAQNSYVTTRYTYCLANDEMDPSDFIEGRVEEMDANGACSTATFSPIEDILINQMTGIAAKLAPGNTTALTSEEQAFINASPFTLLNILRDGAASQTAVSRIEMMARPLTAAYAYRVFDDLLKAMRFASNKAVEIKTEADKAQGVNGRCNASVVKGAFDHFNDAVPRLYAYREAAQQNYIGKVVELNAALAFAESQVEAKRRSMNRTQIGEGQ